MKSIFLPIVTLISLSVAAQPRNKNNKAIFLEDISWTKAKEVLTADAVVVIPLGAAAKEHGPHLPLATDYIQAEHYKNMVALERKVIIAPTLSYGLYPAFVKYPGSTTTFFTTSRNALLDIIRTLSGFGPKRFYVINIGVSTIPALQQAASILKQEGIILYYSDYARPNFDNAEKGIREREAGGHADEMESSNVLFMRPELVDMSKAVDDTTGYTRPGPLTPVPMEPGKYNPSGLIGFATLAKADKGKRYTVNFTKELVKDIDSVASCTLPVPKDNSSAYKPFLGNYTGAKGESIEIGFDNNRLFYIWNKGRDLRKFFPLFPDSEDHFTSMYVDILFVRDEKGEIIKLWCSFRGDNFWMTKATR